MKQTITSLIIAAIVALTTPAFADKCPNHPYCTVEEQIRQQDEAARNPSQGAKSGGGSSAGVVVVPVAIGAGLWLINITPIGIAPLPFQLRAEREDGKTRIFTGTTYKGFSFGVKQSPKEDDVVVGVDWRYTIK